MVKSIAFLGSDGSGKSTIIDLLTQSQELPYSGMEYFHLKPLKQKSSSQMVEDPHEKPLYSKAKSYLKLLFFIYQYNKGWIKNILGEKKSNKLIIFDRYYDDLLVDYKRYRYGGSIAFAKFVRYFIPKPDLYFILVGDAELIYARKKEVAFDELKRQIMGYKELGDNQRYFIIDVGRTPEEIIDEILIIIKQNNNANI